MPSPLCPLPLCRHPMNYHRDVGYAQMKGCAAEECKCPGWAEAIRIHAEAQAAAGAHAAGAHP